MTDWTWSYGQR